MTLSGASLDQSRSDGEEAVWIHRHRSEGQQNDQVRGPTHPTMQDSINISRLDLCCHLVLVFSVLQEVLCRRRHRLKRRSHSPNRDAYRSWSHRLQVRRTFKRFDFRRQTVHCRWAFIVCVMCFLPDSFCLKGEGLDRKSSAVIDYTPYLKFTQRYVIDL